MNYTSTSGETEKTIIARERRDISIEVSSLCEEIKDLVVNTGTDIQVMNRAEEIIQKIRLRNNDWEHLWDAQDGTYKGRCRKCGFTTVFTEGHDGQYRYCPQCGEQKKPYIF